MVLWQVLRAMLRHPALVVAGVALTVAAAVAVGSQPGVYQTRVGVLLVPPGEAVGPNPFWGREDSVIATASLVSLVVNSDTGADGPRTSSTTVSLAGQGVTDGYSVQLFNRGGQWVIDYDRPFFDVQAVGRSEEAVVAHLDTALSSLDEALTELQDRQDVPDRDRMSLQPLPETPEIVYGEGRPTRALAATLLLGGAVTVVAVLLAERATGGRRRPRRQRASDRQQLPRGGGEVPAPARPDATEAQPARPVALAGR